MTDVAMFVERGCQVTVYGLALCSVFLWAALLERTLFWLAFQWRVRREGSARGLFAAFSWVAGVAPMWGILGTVFGIMSAFQSAQVGGQMDPGGVLQGIGTALWTTALGLTAAIVSLTGRALFHGITERALLRVAAGGKS